MEPEREPAGRGEVPTGSGTHTTGTVGSHVFISYARSDAAYVGRLVSFLRNHRLSVWVDREMPNGIRWLQVLKQQIDTCAALVLVMSATAEESRWVTAEYEHALSLGRPMLNRILSAHSSEKARATVGRKDDGGKPAGSGGRDAKAGPPAASEGSGAGAKGAWRRDYRGATGLPGSASNSSSPSYSAKSS